MFYNLKNNVLQQFTRMKIKKASSKNMILNKRSIETGDRK